MVPRREYERCNDYDSEGEDGYREGEDTAHVHPLKAEASARHLAKAVFDVVLDGAAQRPCTKSVGDGEQCNRVAFGPYVAWATI